jgi:hypothetical protein
VQDGEETDIGAEMFGVARNGEQRFGGGAKQDVIDDRLILIGDGGQLRRHGEDDVEVFHWQEFAFALGKPLGALLALAFRAMAIAAGVVADACELALITLVDVATQGRGPAGLNGPHQLMLLNGK